jgi:glycosyltransferase involved in cell wall biosynthesis
MKIGIDARMYRSSVAGIGRYSQNLIKNLLEIDNKNQYVLFMTPADAEEIRKKKIETRNTKIVETNISHFSLAEQTKLPKILEKEKLDLMHFLNFNYPVRYKGKFISVIHDLTLHFYPETAKKTNFLKRAAFSYVMKKACQNSAKIVSVSESTKKDILKIFHIDSKKIKTIYEAADDKIFKTTSESAIESLKQKYHLDFPVILTVGQFRPHKNLPGLIEAFGKLRKEMPAKLVILGKQDPKHTRVYEAIDKTKAKSDIVMPGFVTDEELSLWYKAASVFVFPSFYEGFGLPGLEAMMAGAPVVASNQASLPEVYQDAALYFDPFNTADIAAKIKEVILNKKLQEKLIENGRKISRKYSWKKTAEETLDLYKQV